MKQNILLITADQFRYDAFGHRGVFPVRTPHLDALAAGGTVFDQAYTPYPMCVPARASIMTGLHCFRHGVYYNDQGWPDRLQTLPGVLAANGYYTIEVGKTHFIPRRRHGGFHKMILPEDLHTATVNKYGRPKTSLPSETRWDDMIVRHVGRTWNGRIAPEDYEPIYFATRAIQELEKLVIRRECIGDADEPFFMWLSMLQPHSPCAPPPPYGSMYRPEDIPPPVKSEEEKSHFAAPLRGFAEGWKALTPEMIASFRARYLGSVSLVDEQVGRVIAALSQLGLRENTMVIFTTDHGEYFGDHHQMQKAFFHDASSRVPLIFNGPGVAAGAKLSGEASLCDLKPTVLDLCGLVSPSIPDARGASLYESIVSEDTLSLLPALRGSEMPEGRVNISESGIYGQGIMAKRGSEKFNFYPQTMEFDHFDLAADPDELHNLGRDVRLDTLPDWARENFEKVLTHTRPLNQRSYFFNGKVRPMFT